MEDGMVKLKGRTFDGEHFPVSPANTSPMSRPVRRKVQEGSSYYGSVPQASPPRSASFNHHYQAQGQAPQPQIQASGSRPAQSSSMASNRRRGETSRGHSAMAIKVATGSIGAGYGPYSYHPEQVRETGVYRANSRFSNTPSSDNSVHNTSSRERGAAQALIPTTTTVPQYMWDKETDPDDALHIPDRDPPGCCDFTIFSLRGWTNALAIVAIVAGLLVLFIGYPVIVFKRTAKASKLGGFNVGGINGSGQIPFLPNLPELIDRDTPRSAYTRTGTDNKLYDLVFSDEFNTDGRSFYPGDDPFWEAADLHYWATGDMEWYDPSAVTTRGGSLVITMSEQRVHDLDFQSGMITSWNKFCLTTGYIEVSVRLPGKAGVPGLWPGVWSLGNLGRAGYGASTEGTWPYSYDSCDVGTFPFQQDRSGNPQASNGLSGQPGQKLSSCTCPGSDHPGPSVTVGRGVPELDIIEARVDIVKRQGLVSQSLQVAPYSPGHNWIQSSPATTLYNTTLSFINGYIGGPLQEAISADSYVEDQFYDGQEFTTFGTEYWSDPNHRDDGYITWFSNNEKTWTVTPEAIGPRTETNVSQRLIPEEPMYLIFNLGMAVGFQPPDLKNLVFPAEMLVDYVRVYQRRGIKNGVGCNPPNRPTTNYINKHMVAYTNPNLTTWADANFTFPRNSIYHGCT